MAMAQTAICSREASNSAPPLRHSNCLPHCADYAEAIWSSMTEATDTKIRVKLLSSCCRIELRAMAQLARAAAQNRFTAYRTTP